MAFQSLFDIGCALHDRLEKLGFRQVLSVGPVEIRQLRQLLESRRGTPVAVIGFRTVEYDRFALKRTLRVEICVSVGSHRSVDRRAGEGRTVATAVQELFRAGAAPVAGIEFLPVSMAPLEDGEGHFECYGITLEGIEFSR